jgi:hypothetical protein
MKPIRIIPPVTGIQYLRCLRENGRARSFDTLFVYHTHRRKPRVLAAGMSHPLERGSAGERVDGL